MKGVRAWLVVAAACCLASCGKPVTELRLIAPPIGLDRAVAEQIANLVAEDAGVRIRLVPQQDGLDELDALIAGSADIAFAPNNERYRGEINTIMPLYQSVLHILVHRERAALDSEAILTGARIYAGPPGSIARSVGELMIQDAGFSRFGVEFVDEIGDEMEGGGFDILLMYVPIDRERVLSVPNVDEYRLLSLGAPHEIGTGGNVDRAVLLNPRLRPIVIPARTYDDVTPEPIVSLAVDNLLVTRADLDPAVVYDLYGELIRIRPALFGDRPELFQPIDESILRANWTFALHPGALAFLQQDEPTFIERYSGVAEVVVTLVVALVSGTFALARIISIRRKNRIDRFYTEVIGIRDSVPAGAPPGEREAAIDRIRDLQNHAFELLVGEKLAADESFRIFIDLTNSAVADIEAGEGSPGPG